MNFSCFKLSCLGRAIIKCDCISPSVFCCSDHVALHMMTQGVHTTESLVIQLGHEKKIELLPKITDLLKTLEELKKHICENAGMLIDFIAKESKQALGFLQDLEEVWISILKDDLIYKDNYEKALGMDAKVNSAGEAKQIEWLRNNISSLFEINADGRRIWEDCNEIIFSTEYNVGGLSSIDLDTLRRSALDFAPKIGSFCEICKIGKDTYFIHGGRFNNNKSHRVDTYLINPKKKSVVKLKDGPVKDYGGAVLKNSKVYLFGGSSSDILIMQSSEIFDLKENEWKSIHPLPAGGCYAVTAALQNNEIILSGLQFNCCYSYNDITYTNILTLDSNYYKIVCEGWIFANSILYENVEKCNNKWISHRISQSWNCFLWTHTTFKRNNFFYFIDGNNVLMRINTKLKILENIGYS